MNCCKERITSSAFRGRADHNVSAREETSVHFVKMKLSLSLKNCCMNSFASASMVTVSGMTMNAS